MLPIWSTAVVRAEMRRAIGAITGKWKLEILWLRNRRTHRFGELRSIPRITQHILTAQLRELEADGLISRKIFAEGPPRVEYSITPAARALKPVMDALFSWWEEFGPSPEVAAHGDQLFGPPWDFASYFFQGACPDAAAAAKIPCS